MEGTTGQETVLSVSVPDNSLPSPPPDPRAAAFAEGPQRIPRRFVRYLVAGLVIFALGGVLLNRVFTAAGLNPVGTPPTGPAAPTPAPTIASPGGPPAQLPAPVSGSVAPGHSALMSLSTLAAKPAPAISLTGGDGRAVTLQDFVGKVVVVSFFNGKCNDICPVLGSEMAQADHDLGSRAGQVEFVTVNSDPLSPLTRPTAQQVFGAGAAPANWVFASGTVQQLDRVWSAYGITVDVVRSTGAETHSDLLYFIDPTGRLRYVSTPFANESSNGVYGLPPQTVSSWAQGISEVVTGLLP